MSAPVASSKDEIIDWIVRYAVEHDDLGVLLAGLCERLIAARLPVLRANMSLPAVDPDMRAISYGWRRGGGTLIETVPHGPEQEARFQRGVIHHLYESGLLGARWRLERGEGVSEFDLLRTLRSDGASDYLMRLVPFGRAETALRGVALSIATDRPGGFSDGEIAYVVAVVPALGLAAYRVSVARMTVDALSIYVGQRSAQRVLAGEIQRGEGHTIHAAILFSDLKGFTALSEREDPKHVVRWLNEHLEALGDAVIAHGGEILKFMGDGLLAVFPVQDREAAPCSGCEAALRAALDALAANRALNERRASGGEPQLDADIALHFGDVVYGNVGAKRRLDFTVIGRAVNEASRMEALCDTTGENLIMSMIFAERCGRPTVSLGTFSLRGIVGERTVHRLDAVALS